MIERATLGIAIFGLALVGIAAGLAGPSAAASALPAAPAQPAGARGVWRDHACADCIASLAATEDVIWVGTLSAGVTRIDRRDGSVRRFTRSEGLVGRGVDLLDIGPEGDVWIALATGLTRGLSAPLGLAHFDGLGWTLHTVTDGLPSARVVDLEAGPGGSVLVATAGGFGYFDGHGWSTLLESEGAPAGAARSVAIGPDGALWAGSDSGLARFDGLRWHDIPLDGLDSSEVNDLVLAPGGQLWAAIGTGLAQYDPGSAQWTGHPGIVTGSPSQNDRISVDDRARVWVVNDLEVHRFEDGRWQRVPDTDAYLSQHGGHWPAGAFVGADGSLLMGFHTEGIALWDGRAWQRLLTRDGPTNLVAFALDFDARDQLWAGYFPLLNEDNILDSFDGQRWSRHTKAEGMFEGRILGIPPGALDADRLGNLWVGVDGMGVAHHDGATWTRVTTETMGVARIHRVAADEQGGAWIGTDAGVVHLGPTGPQRYTRADGLVGDTVYGIAVDTRGPRDTVWFDTDRGVSGFDGRTWTTYTRADGLADDSVVAIAVEASGTLWFGTDGGGLTRFDGRSWTTYRKRDGLGGDGIWAVDVDPAGYVWAVASEIDLGDGGVSRFDGRRWETFRMADGLMDDGTFDIAFDRDGHAWIATLAGISELVPPPGPAPLGSTCLCQSAREGAPAAVIDAALADPASVSGWGLRRNPSAPPGPMNPLRECLTLQRADAAYHPIYNGLTWRTGCP